MRHVWIPTLIYKVKFHFEPFTWNHGQLTINKNRVKKIQKLEKKKKEKVFVLKQIENHIGGFQLTELVKSLMVE